jgi:MFS superfamily sulfate permease-like transporter
MSLKLGIGNNMSSLIGGLPMTSVVVHLLIMRWCQIKMSAIIRCFTFNKCAGYSCYFNKIPLATLAILILVGYKLAKPATFKHFWKRKISIYSFYCYLVAVVTTDLLKEFF